MAEMDGCMSEWLQMVHWPLENQDTSFVSFRPLLFCSLHAQITSAPSQI